MENPHGREIHYHLARAVMHMNYIAGVLPFFEPSVDWDDHPQDLYGRANRVPPQARHLHTFVPIPSSSSVPTLVSHGGMPSHMVLNPEPNLRPLSILREGNPLSDHHSANYPPQAGHTSSSSIRTPASETFLHTTTRDPDGIRHIQSQNRPLRGTLVQRRNNDQLSLQRSLQMNPQHLHLLCRSSVIFRETGSTLITLKTPMTGTALRPIQLLLRQHQ